MCTMTEWMANFDLSPGDFMNSPSPMSCYQITKPITVAEKVKCPTCGKLYASKKSLKIHVRIHTGYKPYLCHLCPKRFTQTNVLKAHINFHIGRRDWVCRICKKAFTQSAHLRTHEKTHVHQKDYECDFCHQSFSSKGVRDRHTRQHTGEKPYRCNLCSKSFTRGESLKFHSNAHQGIRPFHCPETNCLSTFTKQSSLKRHIATCHGNLHFSHRLRIKGCGRARGIQLQRDTDSPPALCMSIGEEEQVVAKVEKMGRLDEVLSEVLKLTETVNVERTMKVNGVFDEVLKLSKTVAESPLPYYNHAMMPQGQYIKQEEGKPGFLDDSFEENSFMGYSYSEGVRVNPGEAYRRMYASTWCPDYAPYSTPYCHHFMMM